MTKIIITITNEDSWPAIDENSDYVGNDLEWEVHPDNLEMEGDPLLTEVAEKYCKWLIDTNTVNSFKPGEQIEQEFDLEHERQLRQVMSTLGKKSAQKRKPTSEQMRDLANKRWSK